MTLLYVLVGLLVTVQTQTIQKMHVKIVVFFFSRSLKSDVQQPNIWLTKGSWCHIMMYNNGILIHVRDNIIIIRCELYCNDMLSTQII